jgi:hypothetical protein
MYTLCDSANFERAESRKRVVTLRGVIETRACPRDRARACRFRVDSKRYFAPMPAAFRIAA